MTTYMNKTFPLHDICTEHIYTIIFLIFFFYSEKKFIHIRLRHKIFFSIPEQKYITREKFLSSKFVFPHATVILHLLVSNLFYLTIFLDTYYISYTYFSPFTVSFKKHLLMHRWFFIKFANRKISRHIAIYSAWQGNRSRNPKEF